jgi:hypothetical protein
VEILKSERKGKWPGGLKMVDLYPDLKNYFFFPFMTLLDEECATGKLSLLLLSQ